VRDQLIERERNGLILSTDRRRLDVGAVLALLVPTHWGGTLTRERLERAIENSLCVGVYDGARLLAFARVVTDLATYAYLTDVIVAEAARGAGIGTWMVQAIVEHPDLQGLRRIALLTRDARKLYERFGFTTDPPTSVYMELRTRP
jgi:ribosomal protein S18 acetylase RimI-like enzyme